MFSTPDWQLVCSVVVDDLWDGGEGGAVLAKHVTTICKLSELHMHESFAAPGRERDRRDDTLSDLVKPGLLIVTCTEHD